jgi:metal-responsive CopG/Arc/MetJ family transcriptional regulator
MPYSSAVTETTTDIRTPISVRLSPEDIRELDAIARRKGYPRGELIRRMVRRGIKYADDIPTADTEGPLRPRVAPPA